MTTSLSSGITHHGGGAPHTQRSSVLVNEEGEAVKVSQFMELQGLKAVEGEDPPRILHFNPRLNGD